MWNVRHLVLASLLCGLSCHLSVVTAQAQNAAPPASQLSIPPGRALAKSASVRSGQLVGFDAAQGTLALRNRAGQVEQYALSEKMRYMKGKKEVEATDFKVGDLVVAHLRKSRETNGKLVSELSDMASWTWLSEVRRNVSMAVVKSVGEDTLEVAVGTEGVPLTYHLSDHTLCRKNGKEATPTDFKAGDKIYVAPRPLPSGEIQARAIADSETAVAQLKEESGTTVHGVIKTVDPAAHKLTLLTRAGETRDLIGTPDTNIHKAGKTLTWSLLKSGTPVSVRLRSNEVGDTEIWRITIESIRSVAKARGAKNGR